MERCRVCDGNAAPFGSATVRGAHEVSYYRCGQCGFVQTEEPYWLDEAYTDPIGATDIGILSRNVRLARTTQAVITSLFDSDGRFVDYGGGYGILVRLMRDRGFDFYRHDPFCENLFARGFEQEDATRADLVTAFEVFEHLPDPVEGASRMAEISDHVLFTTLLLPEPAPKPGEWWYYTLEGGQHVSLYSRGALSALAQRLGMFVSSANADTHLLTRSRRAAKLFPWIANAKAARLITLRNRRRSFTEDDYVRAGGSPIT